MNVPGVVKNFVWKTDNDILPTKKNVFHRKVAKNPIYPICEREEETVSHSLLSCATSNDVWANPSTPIQKWSSEEDFLKI